MATLKSEPERAVEAFEGDTCNINSSTQHINVLQVSDAIEEYPVIKQDDADVHVNRTYLARLSKNIFSSGKKILEFVTVEAQLIGNQVTHAFVMTPELPPPTSTTLELPPSIIETCQLILDKIKEPNNKWLDETEYLLQNKVLTIGVFGRHKAGKSTLLNALLYHEVLSVADTNETAFILRICHKPSDHHGSSCFEDTEQFLSMKEEEIKGRRNIRRAIQKKNTDIRDNAATISVDEVVAHVPFLCHCATDDINIVLLDTPGLAESDKLGISEVSEYQLMTCSAYVYVISSQQMEDTIDTDSLRAIVKRDPNAFEERRIIVAVTRLDLYNTKPKDESDSDSDSDDESSPGNDEEEILKRIESIKEVIQRQCKDLDVPIPDDCIVPLCATRALKARKKIIKIKNEKPIQESKLSAAEDREKISQVPVLEKKLIEIASNSHYLWHYNIVRDCTRYCDQAMEKLDETKKEFVRLKNKYNGKVKEKEDIMNEFKKVETNLKSNYKKGSKFCSDLETAYDKDLKKNEGKINEVYKSRSKTFEKFRSDIEKEGDITAEQFNLRADEIIENENESLTNDLKDLPFREVDVAVCNSTYSIGIITQKLEECLASYCNTTTSMCEDLHLQESSIISESISDSGKAVDSPHLKLSDLLEQSKVHYNFFDRIKKIFKKIFIAEDDPTRVLLKSEVEAFLKELEEHFMAGCHDYFQKIKPNIVEGYLKQHRKIAEEHIADVERHYFEERVAIDAKVKAWRTKANCYQDKVKSHSDLIDNLEKQKKHLLSLAEKHHKISLFSKHLQDE